MIVADTSVLVPLFIPSDRTEEVQNAMRKDPDWIAPQLWRSEFRNVLATQTRVNRIPLKISLEVMANAEDLLRDREFEPNSDSVLFLASRSGASSSDCEFVALAQLFEISLLTYDRRLTTAFPETAVVVATWLAGNP